MTIKEAKEDLKCTARVYLEKDEEGRYVIPVARQRAVALIGPPGVGKTEIVRQTAEELGIGLVDFSITHHTRQSAVGLPVILKDEYEGKEYSYTEYTMSEIIGAVYKKIKETGCKEGILFIDEYNCASETLAPSMLQLLQYKRFGPHEVPPGWIIVVAGNNRAHNRSVRSIDAVTRDRLRLITIEPDSRVWMEYIKEKNIHPLILSYIKYDPAHFYVFCNTGDDLSCVTARSWEDLSVLIRSYEKMGFPVTVNIVREFISDEKTAGDFFAHYMMFTQLLTNEMINSIVNGTVSGKNREAIRAMPYDKIWAIISALGRLCEYAALEYREKPSQKSLKKAAGVISNCVTFVRDTLTESETDLMTTILLSSTPTAVVISEGKLGSLF